MKKQFKDKDIAWAPKAVYLGVTMDRGLNIGLHVRKTVARVIATRALLQAGAKQAAVLEA